MAKKEAVVTVRLSEEELNALDALTVGPFSRSQVMRIQPDHVSRSAHRGMEPAGYPPMDDVIQGVFQRNTLELLGLE